MGLIHFILDLVALLLWLNWRAQPYDALADARPSTLVGTLRRAERPSEKHFTFLAALVVLLGVRALAYRELGPALNWTGQLNFAATTLAFKSDSRLMMLGFSFGSFLLTLGVFYLWLLLFSTLAGKGDESSAPLRLARAHLGGMEAWPLAVKLVLPFAVAAASWWGLTWPLAYWGLVPPPVSEAGRAAQAGLVGLGAYLAWKYPVLLLLGLHLLHNHVYFGGQSWWNFVDGAARRLLAPLRWLPLRLFRVDLAPLAGIGLVWFLTQGAEHGFRPPVRLDEHGRRMPPAFEIPGLADWYRRISH